MVVEFGKYKLTESVSKLIQLFNISLLERNFGWLLFQNSNSNKFKLISLESAELCRVLASYHLTLWTVKCYLLPEARPAKREREESLQGSEKETDLSWVFSKPSPWIVNHAQICYKIFAHEVKRFHDRHVYIPFSFFLENGCNTWSGLSHVKNKTRFVLSSS